jgi:hypothetical protein
MTIDQDGTINGDVALQPLLPSAYQSLALNRARGFFSRFFQNENEVRDPGQLAVARDALDAAWELHFNENLSPDQLKAVWSAVGAFVANRLTLDELNDYLDSAGVSGIDVKELVRRLATQMNSLAAPGMNPNLRGLARLNAMPVIGAAVGHHFASVSAMPAAV